MHKTREPDSGTGWIVPAIAAASLVLMGIAGYFLYLHAGYILQKGQALSPLLILGLALRCVGFQKRDRVVMVGDGINDAPALMQADVGIAFGSGVDIAIESADVIILNQRLGAVLDAYGVSRYSYRKIVQNVTLAFLFNGLGILAAVTGLVDPIWGMVAMAASVTAIFINSLWGRGAYFFEAIKTVGHASQTQSSAAQALSRARA